jgi:hypothetical protein
MDPRRTSTLRDALFAHFGDHYWGPIRRVNN